MSFTYDEKNKTNRNGILVKRDSDVWKDASDINLNATSERRLNEILWTSFHHTIMSIHISHKSKRLGENVTNL